MKSIISQKYSMERLFVGLVNASKGSAAWSFCTHGLWQIHSFPSFTGSSIRENMNPNSMPVNCGSDSSPFPASTAALTAAIASGRDGRAPQVPHSVTPHSSFPYFAI